MNYNSSPIGTIHHDQCPHCGNYTVDRIDIVNSPPLKQTIVLLILAMHNEL